jgi:hypothetical protein
MINLVFVKLKYIFLNFKTSKISTTKNLKKAASRIHNHNY